MEAVVVTCMSCLPSYCDTGSQLPFSDGICGTWKIIGRIEEELGPA